MTQKKHCNPFLISDPADYTSFGVNTLSINNISPQARFSTYIILLDLALLLLCIILNPNWIRRGHAMVANWTEDISKMLHTNADSKSGTLSTVIVKLSTVKCKVSKADSREIQLVIAALLWWTSVWETVEMTLDRKEKQNFALCLIGDHRQPISWVDDQIDKNQQTWFVNWEHGKEVPWTQISLVPMQDPMLWNVNIEIVQVWRAWSFF